MMCSTAAWATTSLYGGDGIDTVSYATATGAARASLAITTAQSTISAGSDTLSGIENLDGQRL